jgi:2-polyprenyl-3-methyl-5-hydroxy-6-metoxy-1,4-benzoquinol methylase
MMTDRMEELYGGKQRSYYAYARTEIAALIPGRGLKVLDVGCGQGATLAELKRSGKASVAVGIEINREAVAEAGKLLDGVIIGNIENLEINYPQGYFDVIIMADVLEHLVDPWGTVKKLKKHLAPDGIMVASLPNIRHSGALGRLLFKGDFGYAEAGIMDRTHLRFFCKRNMVELFHDGFEITGIKTVPELAKGELAWLNRLTLRVFEEFMVIQYIIVARNKALPGPVPGGMRDG